MKNMDPGAHEQLKASPNRSETSSPAGRPGKMADYTNTQEAKLEHTINTDRRKETDTQGERERETRTLIMSD